MITGCNPMDIKILGCGNILASDEGAGIHAVRKMNKYRMPNKVKILEIGRPGTFLLDYIIEAQCIYLIDAMVRGEEPGTIYRFETNGYPPEELLGYSIHGFNLVDAYKLGMKQCPEKMPDKLIIQGIEIKERGKFKSKLSPPVKKGVNKLVRELKKEVLELYETSEI